jgi:CRP-like cAMP-binding protein
MTSGQQRSNTSALSEKEATVNTVVDGKSYAEFLGDIPAFSHCAKDVLEEFVASSAHKMQSGAGTALCIEVPLERCLYVLLAGSASLDAGDDVHVSLEPGDYFGTNPRNNHELIASVTADEDVDVLVISPQDLLQLELASSRSRHPSQLDRRSAAPAVTRLPRRRHRGLVAS